LPLFLLPIAFIICDIILTIVNIIVYKIIPNYFENCNNVNILEKQNVKLRKRIEKTQKYIDNNELSRSKRNCYLTDLHYNEHILHRNEEKIKNINEQQKEIQEQESVNEKDIYTNTYKNKLEEYNDIISKLNDVSRGNGLSKLIQKMNNIMDLIQQKPENIEYLNTTFNIYSTELLNIIYNIDNIKGKEKENYKIKLKEIVDEFSEYLDRIEEKIQTNTLFKMNVDMEVLLEQLKKDKEK
jgi:hypothetical protein